MTDLVADVLRHRLVLSYEALAEGLDADALIQRVMKQDPGAGQAAGAREAGRPWPRLKTAPVGGLPDDRNAEALLQAPRVDGDPPARRPAAGRLPHPDARRRPRPGRPARVPAPRRRAPHRLERHRAAADSPTCASSPKTASSPPGSCSTSRRSVDFGSATAAPSGASPATSSPCSRACSRATATGSAPCSTATRSTPSCRRAAAALHVLDLLQRHGGTAGRVGRRLDRPARPADRRPAPDQAPLAASSWSPTSSARPAGRRRSASWRSATR